VNGLTEQAPDVRGCTCEQSYYNNHPATSARHALVNGCLVSGLTEHALSAMKAPGSDRKRRPCAGRIVRNGLIPASPCSRAPPEPIVYN
jgi:hypothetical protein